MVFSFSLPTTSHLFLQSFVASNSHPSLPQSASTARHALRVALKKHKRLSPAQRISHLPCVHSALNEYIPYLFTVSNGVTPSDAAPTYKTREGDGKKGRERSNNEEDIDILSISEIESEWRPTLSSLPTLQALRQSATTTTTPSLSRAKGRGIEFEIGFVLSTLAYVLSSLARIRYLTTLYANATPTSEQKSAAVQAAMKNLLLASSVHSFIAALPQHPPHSTYIPKNGSGKAQPVQVQVPVPDLDPSTQSALSSLALAEATLLAVLKDDAYFSTCIQSRNTHDTEWMVKAPDIPKVRALLFARLCVRAAEYAEQAVAGAGAVKKGSRSGGIGGADAERKVDDELLNYMRVLARVARAKACRFFAIDAEMAGKVGEGIAWLRAAKGSLGYKGSLTGDEGGATEGKNRSKLSSLSRLKKGWAERKEERKVEKVTSSLSRADERETDIDYGDDAGREEEGRVIDMLETKWMKMNDTVNTQHIPSSTSYLSSLPSGRDIHSPPAPYVPPQLDVEQLARMRIPPGPQENAQSPESSGEENEYDTRNGRYYY